MVYYTIKIFNCQDGKNNIYYAHLVHFLCFAILSCGNFVIFTC